MEWAGDCTVLGVLSGVVGGLGALGGCAVPGRMQRASREDNV